MILRRNGPERSSNGLAPDPPALYCEEREKTLGSLRQDQLCALVLQLEAAEKGHPQVWIPSGDHARIGCQLSPSAQIEASPNLDLFRGRGRAPARMALSSLALSVAPDPAPNSITNGGFGCPPSGEG